MINHFKNIQKNYGKNAYVQIPNGLFIDLSSSIKNENSKTNIKQASFAYAYLVSLAFLYKYTSFIDLNDKTYIQNGDIKTVLGYSYYTKSIDYLIKKNGMLEQMSLIKTVKNYPVLTVYNENEYNQVKAIEFITKDSIHPYHHYYDLIKSIVKNKNYEVKEPTFLFEYNGDAGTLYEYSNTHRVNIDEFIQIITDNELSNIAFMLYFYFKSKCYNLPGNSRYLSLEHIISEVGISKNSFYENLSIIKSKKYIYVNHGGWGVKNFGEANKYKFLGI